MAKGTFKEMMSEKTEQKAGGMAHSMKPMAGGTMTRMGKGKSMGKMKASKGKKR